MSSLERTTFALAGIALVLSGLAWSDFAAGQRSRAERLAAGFCESTDRSAPTCACPLLRIGG